MADLLRNMPDIMKDIREMKAVCQVETEETDALWDCLAAMEKDQYVQEATENGIQRWERLLYITPKGLDDLEVRRFRVLARLNEQIPYTYEGLKNQLALLCGEKGVRTDMDYGAYTLYVWVELAAKRKYEEVEGLLERVVPCNIVVNLSLLYNQHKKLSAYTHSQLKEFTQYGLRNEAIGE